MKKMIDMVTTDLPKDQRKLIKKISVFSPYEIITGVLKFYKCPESCEAQCCKQFDIPLNTTDKARISSHGKGYRKVIKESMKIQYFEAGMVESFTEKPCPFLHQDRCSIHRFQPAYCALYPFKASLPLKLVTCPVGIKLLEDYVAFDLYMSTVNSSSRETVSQKLNEATTCISMINANPGVMEYTMSDMEAIRFFLLYLHNEPKEARAARVEGLKSMMATPTENS